MGLGTFGLAISASTMLQSTLSKPWCNSMSQPPYHQQLCQVFQTEHIDYLAVIQKLWSNYGVIRRIKVPAHERSYVFKYVDLANIPQHPRGWAGATSHARKLSSYINEWCFYQHYAEPIQVYAHSQAQNEASWQAGYPMLAQAHCVVPNVNLLQEHNSPERFLLVLDDLDAIGYTQRYAGFSIAQVRLCIRWLALFHAYFLNCETPDLWPVGSYWHWQTRQDEWGAMPRNELYHHAQGIAQALQTCPYQTLIHGDAKVANFCFHPDGQRVTAVDFQYVGRGVGVVDVMYLLGSALSADELYAHAEALWDTYFDDLRILGIAEDVVQTWRDLIPTAWADFERFLQGWSPGHQKLHAYAAEQTALCLQALISGQE